MNNTKQKIPSFDRIFTLAKENNIDADRFGDILALARAIYSLRKFDMFFVSLKTRYDIKRTEKIDEYTDSSYNEYISNENDIVDADFVYEIIGQESFIEYHNKENEEKCLDIEDLIFRLSDADAMKEIKRVSRCKKCHRVSSFRAITAR